MEALKKNKTDCQIICNRIIENAKKNSLRNKTLHPFDKEMLWHEFKNKFSVVANKPFEYTNRFVKLNLAAIFYYFLEDELFFECPNVYNKDVALSFNKGIFLVSKVGNGKSDIMRSFETIFKNYSPHSYKMVSVSKVVDDFEAIETIHDRKQFYKYYTTGKILFDDLYSEKLANNYGKVNIMREIILRRYDNKCKTHFTMNPIAGFEENPKGNLLQLEEFYGPRTVDRLFDMCNYITISGRSRRV